MPDDLGHHRLAQQFREPLPGRGAIAVLGAMLLGADHEHRARQAGSETLEDPPALIIIQRCRGAQIQAQLDPGIGGVHVLPARTGGPRELLGQLPGRHPQTARRPGPRSHVQIIHAASVPHVRISRPARCTDERLSTPASPSLSAKGSPAGDALGPDADSDR